MCTYIIEIINKTFMTVIVFLKTSSKYYLFSVKIIFTTTKKFKINLNYCKSEYFEVAFFKTLKVWGMYISTYVSASNGFSMFNTITIAELPYVTLGIK